MATCYADLWPAMFGIWLTRSTARNRLALERITLSVQRLMLSLS